MFRGLKQVLFCLLILQPALNIKAQLPQVVYLFQEITINNAYDLHNPEYPNYIRPIGLLYTALASKRPGNEFVLDCNVELPQPSMSNDLCLSSVLTVRKGLSLNTDRYCGLGNFTTTATENSLRVTVNVLPGFTGRFLCRIRLRSI